MSLFRKRGHQPDAFDEMDVTDMCEALNLPPGQVRELLREAERAGLIAVDAITEDSVTLRGTYPDEPEESRDE